MIVRTEINNQAFPLYFMGSEALTAERDALSARVSDDFAEPRIAEIEKELRLLANNREIEVLRNRENEDLFLAKLAAWEQEIAQLNAIEIDPEQIRLVNLDQPATSPRHAIWPKKRIFVMVGVLAGLVLGISAALLRRFIGDAIVAREA